MQAPESPLPEKQVQFDNNRVDKSLPVPYFGSVFMFTPTSALSSSRPQSADGSRAPIALHHQENIHAGPDPPYHRRDRRLQGYL